MTLEIRSRFCLTVFAAGILAVVVAFSGTSALAQNSGGGGSGGNSDNSYVLEKQTYERITRIQKLMGEKKYSQAIAKAKNLLPTAKKQSDYAYALVNQVIAQNYLLLKNYSAAEPYLEKIVTLNALQPRAQRSALYELATLYLLQEQHDKAIQLYKKVIARAEARKKSVRPLLYYHLGEAYYQAKDYRHAYQYIHLAIQQRENAKPTTDAQGKKVEPKPVPKDWYQNLFITVYQQQKYSQANDIAGMLVAKYPDDDAFWNYYVNTYLILKEDKQAAAVYALMKMRGMLKSKEDYKQLVSLYIENGIPYQAARLLSEGLDKGIVPKTEANYNLLSSTWMRAKDWDKALEALGKQAAVSPSGQVYLRQASIYLARFQYGQAITAAQNAIRKGGLDDPGLAWMILGQAAFSAHQTQTALGAFHKAEGYSAHAKSARNWIKYVQQAASG